MKVNCLPKIGDHRSQRIGNFDQHFGGRVFSGGISQMLSANPGDGSFSVSLGVDAAAAGGAVPLVTDVLDGIEKWATRSKRRVAVVIDEVQELLEKSGRTGEGQFRAAVQQHERVGYIFAGSDSTMMARNGAIQECIE